MATAMGGASYDHGGCIALDASGKIYISGDFQGTVDFDPSSTSNFNLTSSGDYDIFISKLDGLGNFVWTKTMGGTDWDFGSVAFDAFGNSYVAGFFVSPSITFDSNTFTNSGTTINPSPDIFIAKLGTINTGIETLEHNTLSLYPNPATNLFTISLPNISQKLTLTINDITGKIIYNITHAPTQKIEVSTKKFFGRDLFCTNSNS